MAFGLPAFFFLNKIIAIPFVIHVVKQKGTTTAAYFCT